MTDTNETIDNATDEGAVPDTNQAPVADQPQFDQDSGKQLKIEADKDAQQEVERLAVLDLETEDDKAGIPLDARVWGSTGHAGADEAMRALQNCGLSTDDAVAFLLDAAMSRDPSKVDQKALIAKIGPRRTKSVMDGIETFSRDMRPKDERLGNDVFQYTNGSHALHRLIEQAGNKLSASEVQGHIIAINKGGSSARRAVESLRAVVSGKATALDRRVHTKQYATVTPAPQNKAADGITAKAYVDALQALHAPGNRLSFEERARREVDLHEARRIGRASGLQ